MFSIVLIDLQGKLNINEYLQFVGSINASIETLYCSSSVCNNNKISNYIFDPQENADKIINSVTQLCNGEKIIVVRDALQFKKIKNLVKEYTSNNQIICYQHKLNKFKGLLFKLSQKIVNLVYGYLLQPIDHTVVLYGEITTKVLKNINAPSVLMKTNNWEGIEFKLLNSGQKYVFPYNKKKVILQTLLTLCVSVALFIIGMFVNFNVFAVSFVYYSMALLFLIFSAIFACKWIIKSHFGENVVEKAKIIKGDN